MTLPALLPDDLGTDLDVVTDIGLRWNLATAKRNLGCALARRLSTPRGTFDYEPNYGFDLRSALNAGHTATKLSQLRAAISDECEKDERVEACDADVRFNFGTSTLTVNLTITTADGPFDLILLVTSVTVAMLNRNQPTDVVPPGQVGVVINIGAQGLQGPPGVGTVGPTSAGSGPLDLSFPSRMGSNSGAQEVTGQLTADFGNVPAGVLTVNLSGLARSAAGTATYRLWIGGSSNGVDGSLAGTTTVATPTDTQVQISASISNPTGVRLVKVSIQSSGSGIDAQLADAVISIHG